jgi:peptidoglycan hydrolase FlgJ
MAFNPRSDIVQEVMSAADPSRASLAAERLATLGQTSAKGDFVAHLAKTETASKATDTTADGLASARDSLASLGEMSGKAAKAKVEFEAMLLNSFVGELLPKDAGDVFGKGQAGEMWRSMLSEQVSRQIARSGALGLSRRLFSTHDLPGAQARTLVHATAAPAAQMSANALSAPAAADVVGGAILSTGARRS